MTDFIMTGFMMTDEMTDSLGRSSYLHSAPFILNQVRRRYMEKLRLPNKYSRSFFNKSSSKRLVNMEHLFWLRSMDS